VGQKYAGVDTRSKTKSSWRKSKGSAAGALGLSPCRGSHSVSAGSTATAAMPAPCQLSARANSVPISARMPTIRGALPLPRALHEEPWKGLLHRGLLTARARPTPRKSHELTHALRWGSLTRKTLGAAEVAAPVYCSVSVVLFAASCRPPASTAPTVPVASVARLESCRFAVVLLLWPVGPESVEAAR
jgi:hypothetical protein